MGFDINYHWTRNCSDRQSRNEHLAALLVAEFPSLQRFPLDLDAIAKSIDVPRSEVLARWCQVELNDESGELGRAVITLWLDYVSIEVSSSPAIGIEATLQQLAPLFDTLAVAGLALDPEFDVVKEYQLQQSRVERVARIVGEGG